MRQAFVPLTLVSMGLSFVLGRAAIHRIPAGWPESYGVGAAMTGTSLVPLVTLEAAMFLLLQALWSRVLFFFVFCPIYNAWVIARRRRRFLGGLAR